MSGFCHTTAYRKNRQICSLALFLKILTKVLQCDLKYTLKCSAKVKYLAKICWYTIISVRRSSVRERSEV